VDGFEYVSLLSIEEKILFVKLIVKVIGGDGRIDEAERAFVKTLSRQYQIPSQYSNEVYSYADEDELLDQAAALNNRTKSLYLIKELLTVANTDNDLADSEIDFIVQVANAVNIEDSKVTEINQLVLDRYNWLERYRNVMEIDD
jgi:uncharacterized tellurite resistance protein B-like protein